MCNYLLRLLQLLFLAFWTPKDDYFNVRRGAAFAPRQAVASAAGAEPSLQNAKM